MGLFDAFGTGAQRDAANSQISGITAGLGDLTKSFGQGRNALQTNYAAGLQPFIQNYGQAQQGGNALGNALGLNGPQGNAAAIAAFQNNPGYQFQLQQGENAILANQAKSGQLASGATNLDLLNYGQGVANQGWNQYVQNLNPYLNFENQGATGIGSLYSGLGNQLNQNYAGQGQAQYGAETAIGNANAQADLARLTASQNQLGAIAGGAALAAKVYAASDARVKDDIEPVGELYDGQQVYKYRYKGDDRHQIGLIAQEVERHDPGAVREFHGIKHVNYDRATRPAAGYVAGLLNFAI